MFEKIFKDPMAIARHKNAPYVEERERYLAYCAQECYARNTLFMIAEELLWVARKLSVYPDIRLNSEQIKAAAKGWTQREHSCGRPINTQRASARFIRVATQWLRFLGHFKDVVPEPTPFANLVEDFARWMKTERGLATPTIKLRCYDVGKFLHWYGAREQDISTVKVSDIDSFLAAGGRNSWCRASVARCAKSIRSFFNYAGIKGWCPSSIAEATQAPRMFSEEGLPSGPRWEDVNRLIASMETDIPSDIRDRAIVMLFSIYALRAGEVSNLRLEDIDWEHNRIWVERSKSGQGGIYPLVPIVGNAIVRYLKEVRPQCARREVFITITPPFRPVFPGALYALTQRRLSKLAIHLAHRGPHSLRHACAGHLVSEGFSLKEIGDHLGHRSFSATRIYAKVNLRGLQEVAKFDMGGVL